MKNLFKVFTILVTIVFTLVFISCDNGSGESKYIAPTVFYDVEITVSPATTIDSGSTVTLTASKLIKKTTYYNDNDTIKEKTEEEISFDGYIFDWSFDEDNEIYVTEPSDVNAGTFSFKGRNTDTSYHDVKVTLKIKNSDGITVTFGVALISIKPAVSN